MYTEIECLLPVTGEDDLAWCLDGASVLGTILEPTGVDRLCARIFFAAGSDHQVMVVRQRLEDAGFDVGASAQLPDRDWLAPYRELVRPFAVGRRWWIDPHPDRPTAAPDSRLRLVLEPRRAFGTGSHESTALVLEAVDRQPPVDLAVLDVGTGSGVLALACDRLGALRVVAHDVDPEAIWVARDVARQQEWSPAVEYFIGPIAALAEVRFDLVLCNMVSEQFAPLMEAIVGVLAPAGEAVFSGILVSERDDVIARLGAVGLCVRDENEAGGWLAVRVARV